MGDPALVPALRRTSHGDVFSRRLLLRCAALAGALGLANGCGLASLQGSPPRIARVGVLAFDDGTGPRWDAFRSGLHNLGWIEGQNLSLDMAPAYGQTDLLPSLATHLVGLPADVLVSGGTQAALVAKAATETIPIVMPAINDPLGSGLVASFAHPGGNASGSSLLSPEVAPKWIELLKNILPGITQVAVLVNNANPSHQLLVEQSQAAAGRLGLRVRPLELGAADDLASTVEAGSRENSDALVVLPDVMFFTLRAELIELTMRDRLPTMYPSRDYADAGGLLAYGANVVELYRRAAGYVDKILHGARAGDLPVEQPTTFELVVNRTSLQRLGLTIPASVAPLVTEWV
jgi:putative ABC transport system substrate-binding protein